MKWVIRGGDRYSHKICLKVKRFKYFYIYYLQTFYCRITLSFISLVKFSGETRNSKANRNLYVCMFKDVFNTNLTINFFFNRKKRLAKP